MKDILELAAGVFQPASDAEHLMGKQRAQATHPCTPQQLL